MDNSSNEALAARSTGLDLGRCVVMVIVIFAHGIGWLFLQGPYDAAKLMVKMDLLAHYSVEFFFALTGFLAGRVLLCEVANNPSVSAVGRYVGRRWLRTLPVYYIALMGVYSVQGWTTGNWVFNWNYVFFLQNFHDAAVGFFPTSWYMAVEQWAYMLLPVVVLGLPLVFTRKGMSYGKSLFLSLLGVILFFVLLRTYAAVMWVEPSPIGFDTGIRKQTHLQLEVLLYGLMAAHCKFARPDWYKKLSSLPVFIVAAGLLMGMVVFQYKSHFFVRQPLIIEGFALHAGLGLAVVGTLMALMLPFLDINPLTGWLNRWAWLHRAITTGSQYSYSLYLVHFTIMEKLNRLLPLFRPVDAHPALEIAMQCALLAFGIWLSFVLARWLYHHVEVPALRLRKLL